MLHLESSRHICEEASRLGWLVEMGGLTLTVGSISSMAWGPGLNEKEEAS